MKKIIIFCFASLPAYSADFIFANGFETPSMISGSVSGMFSSGLSVTLKSEITTEFLVINSNGAFSFNYVVPDGDSWDVEISTLPDNSQQQSCSITNNQGVMNVTPSVSVTIVCDTTAWNWDEMNWGQGGWN